MITGTTEEIQFWKTFTTTQRFKDNWLSDSPNPEQREWTRELIRLHSPQNTLDCGSGACSILTGTVKNITATDLLAEEYRKMLDYSQYPHVSIPKAIPTEELPFEDEFDLVIMSNALDHTQQPNVAFENLLKACKVGGMVIIQGFVDEAVFENWRGMHQWNISGKNRQFTIQGKKQSFVYNCKQSDILASELLNTGKQWITLVIKKDGSEKLETL
ncbi:MAG: class I SAM-dependent methyltransferase [Ignavibacteriaceae bacterium]|nr:class I SAM-dependent methyltransferase [Ignavibacteriaceae bacterium]